MEEVHLWRQFFPTSMDYNLYNVYTMLDPYKSLQ